MQFNSNDRELTLKLVYYEPALSGKTTNIRALHALLDPARRGRLMAVETKGDRTLFFDLLPLHFRTRSGFQVKLKLFTVPGQVTHESTRRVVLAGTDAICFIADSQRSERNANNQAFAGMLQNLRDNGLDPDRLPTVIQFNKLDLADTFSDEDIEEYARLGKEPVYKAVAIRGEGVKETIEGCLSLLWKRLDEEQDFSRKLGISREEFMGMIFGAMRGSGGESGV